MSRAEMTLVNVFSRRSVNVTCNRLIPFVRPRSRYALISLRADLEAQQPKYRRGRGLLPAGGVPSRSGFAIGQGV